MQDIITVLGLILGILGLLATCAGLYISYVSYINPMKRFTKYLSKPEGWERANKDAHLTVFRYKKQPGFQITSNWNEVVTEGFTESWIRDYPDREHNSSYYVTLEANGVFLLKELFVTLDGGRGFVPVPKIKLVGKNKKRHFYYNQLQIRLARIISSYPLEDSIEKFASTQKVEIEVIK